jgi:hypothetical protein
LPPGFDFTAQVGAGPEGDGDGDGVGDPDGDADGDGVGDPDGDGDGVLPPSQAPRSFHNEGVAAGFQPAPGYAVCATIASYNRPL